MGFNDIDLQSAGGGGSNYVNKGMPRRASAQ